MMDYSEKQIRRLIDNGMTYLQAIMEIKKYEDETIQTDSNVIPNHVLSLTTKEGYVQKFWDLVNDMGLTHTAAYELLEEEYRAYFGKHRYKNFSSFRRRRDDIDPLRDEDCEYFYIFLDPLEKVSYLGKSHEPIRLFKNLQRGNSRLIISQITRNFDYEMIMERVSDYKSVDGSYKLPESVYYSICRRVNVADGYKLTKAATDLMIKHRGKSGVYVFEDTDGNALYVGIAEDLHQRPRQSFSARFKFHQEPVYLSFYPCNKADAFVVEMYLICRDKPIYNRAAISRNKLTIQLENLPPKTERVRANRG